MKRRLANFARAFDKALIEISAFKEEIKLGLGKNEITGVEGINSGKEAFFKSLANENEASAVIVQTLAACAALIEKYKQVTRKRVLFDHVFDATKEGVVTCPHVCRLSTEENFSSTVQCDHADFFKNSISMSTPAKRIIRPPVHVISAPMQGPLEAAPSTIAGSITTCLNSEDPN